MSEETKHSPEPWGLFQGGKDRFPGIEAADCADIVVWGDEADEEAGVRGDTPEVSQANARRIVAAVNAVAGLSTEALEAGRLVAVVQAARALLRADDAYETSTLLPGNRRAAITYYLDDLRDALGRLTP